MKNTIINQEHETEWFFVYAAYSHRYKKVSMFAHFSDRDEHFTMAARHFYSDFHALVLAGDVAQSNFPGLMKKWHVSFCDGAYRTDYFDNLIDEHFVSSIGFGTIHTPEPCGDKCNTCETGHVSTCITCAVNRSGPPACACDDGYYENEAACSPCSYHCSSCYGYGDCTSCNGNRINAPHCSCPANTYDT